MHARILKKMNDVLIDDDNGGSVSFLLMKYFFWLKLPDVQSQVIYGVHWDPIIISVSVIAIA